MRMLETRAIPFQKVVVVGLLASIGPAMAAPYVSRNGYEITAPAGWKMIRGAFGTEVAFIAPARPGFAAANINVMITPSAPGKAIDRDLVELRAAYPKMFTNYQRVDDGYTT